MNNNLERLVKLLKEQAELIDKINESSDFRYKSTQALVLEYGQPFTKKVKSPFKGKIKSCFENCFQALFKYPNLHYCEGFAIDDKLPLAISHAWLINEEGETVDPTWIGEQYKNSVYFGIVFDKEFVFEFAKKIKHYGILDSGYMNDYQLQREGFPPHALLTKATDVL
ncbi:hypothetical protein [Trichocoleus sp. DQ-U1]|uniref:hypothetical protein n=1 Tax=Trichocoleus sp. DQ-U1 TaxID=2933926 RepID=UPI00329770FD